MSRISKIITNAKDLDYILNITEEEATKRSFIMEMFGEFKGKRRFNVYDTFIVPKGVYGPEGKKNKEPFKTTVGIWIFNKVFIERQLFDMFGYINRPINKGMVGDITDKNTEWVLEDKCEMQVLKDFIMKAYKFMPYVVILSDNYTMKMLTVSKRINVRKAELIKKYRKELDEKDPEVAIKIQNELLDLAKDILKGDPSMDMYDSGARGKFNNTFKNLFIMKGITRNPDPTKGYNIIMSNYIDGVSKEEYADLANSLAEGPYFRSNRTEVGGYWEKLMLPAYQHVQILPEGTDCGTKRTIKIHLTKDNVKEYMYSYIKEGNKLIELTSDLVPKYLGKDVEFRFSSMCEEKDGKKCHKCAGNLFNRLGAKNVGAAMVQVASKLKLVAMKSFHDSQVVMTKLDADKAFGFK